jgi:hypothetical protein
MFGVLVYLMLVLLVLGRHCLDVAIDENLQDLEEPNIEQQ